MVNRQEIMGCESVDMQRAHSEVVKLSPWD